MEEQSNTSAATGTGTSYPGHSSFLQAFPAEADYLDCFSLVQQPEELSAWLITILQGAEAVLSLDLAYQARENVWHLYREVQNQLEDKGESFLHLGFPVLAIRHEEQRVSAPVFLWSVDLIPDPYHTDNWQIRVREGETPTLNPYVRPLLLEYFAGTEWEDALQGDASMLISAMKAAGETSTELAPFPEALPPEYSRILWSMLLGIFPPKELFPQGQADLAFLAEKTGQQRPGRLLSHLPLNPWQQAGFACSQQHGAAVISGGPATGKTHLLEHLVVHALGSGERVLVISERTDVHTRLLRRLDVLQLRHLAFSVREGRADGQLLLQLMGALIGRDGGGIRFDRARFEQAYTRYARTFERFHQHVQAVRRPVFGALNWTQTVGRFLASNRLIGRELLANQLEADAFSHSPAEYEELLALVAAAQPLYEAVGTLTHPLSKVAPRIYLALDKAEAKAYLNQQLDEVVARFSRLQHEIILSLNHYTDRLQQFHLDYARRMQERLTRLFQMLEDGQVQYGDNFLRSSNASIRLYQPFSSRAKGMQALREKVREEVRQLQAAHELDGFFDYSFPAELDNRSMQAIQQALQVFAEALATWEATIPELIAPYRKRVSQTHHHPRLNWSGEAGELSDKLDRALEVLNSGDLLREQKNHQALTLEKQQQYVEQLLAELHELSLSMRDFSACYDWCRFWLHLEPEQQHLLRAIIRVKPADWGVAFSSWYLDQVLGHAYCSDLPEQAFVHRIDLSGLREDYRSFIAYWWAVQQNDYTQTLKRRQRDAYQALLSGTRTGAGYAGSLSQLFARYERHITQYLPLFIANSLQASRTFAECTSSPFDLIIFEGAQYTPERTAQRLLPLAKRSIFIGDDQYIHGDDRADVLEGVQALGLPEVRLYACGGPDHEATQAVYREPEIRQVGGRYDPELMINEVEVSALLQGLNTIPKTVSRTFPRVGIVAFTRSQRNLLAQQILRLKKSTGEGEQLIGQLERNGLRILALDELSGHRFHTLFCSLTYGITSLEGNLPDEMAVLNTREGQRQLYELTSCATHAVHVVHSIPVPALRTLGEASGAEGYRTLLNFITRPADEGQATAQEATEEEDLFLREIALRLEYYLGRERILRTFDTKGWGRGLVIAPARAGHAHYLLVPDGLLAKADASNPEWEYSQQENLRNHGLEPIPVWSLRWWRNAEEEARRLASHIFNLDKEVYGGS